MMLGQTATNNSITRMELVMKCPQCKTNDVYLSSSGNSKSSFWTKVARCHRCCYLFKVPRWVYVPDKEPARSERMEPIRRAA